MPKVIVYSTNYSPFCVRAKQLLDRKGVEYEEIRVDNDPKLMREMMEHSQRRTVPQIFIDNQSIGGHEELSQLDRSGELDSLLGSTE